MAIRSLRARCLRRGRHHGVPVLLVAIVVAFLAIATLTPWFLANRADAQLDPTVTVRGLIPTTWTPMSTPRLIKTRTPSPTPWIMRTHTPDVHIVNVVVSPTWTSTPKSEVGYEELSMSADAWKGGYFQGNAVYYGRAWTALYGAQSDYPRATLSFTLTDDPTRPINLIVSGLDDEWPAKNQIELEVNGQRLYLGACWFANWDSVGTGQQAAWTTVQLTIPPDVLIKGTNRITLRNATEAAKFGMPPYVLLSSVRLSSEEAGIFGKAAMPQITAVVIDDSDTDLRSAQSSIDQ